jgi:hypothetical protein
MRGIARRSGAVAGHAQDLAAQRRQSLRILADRGVTRADPAHAVGTKARAAAGVPATIRPRQSGDDVVSALEAGPVVGQPPAHDPIVVAAATVRREAGVDQPIRQEVRVDGHTEQSPLAPDDDVGDLRDLLQHPVGAPDPHAARALREHTSPFGRNARPQGLLSPVTHSVRPTLGGDSLVPGTPGDVSETSPQLIGPAATVPARPATAARSRTGRRRVMRCLDWKCASRAATRVSIRRAFGAAHLRDDQTNSRRALDVAPTRR